MTSQLVTKLETLAHSLQSNVSAEIAEYAPKLRTAASDLEHKLESWTTAVEHWVELHFTEVAEKAREEAGAAYREAVKVAHDLHAKASAATN